MDDQATTTIKRLGKDRVGGYGIVWGNPAQRDLEGQFFTPETYLGKALGVPSENGGRTIPVKFDWLFEHTLEELPDEVNQFGDMRDHSLGVVGKAKPDEIGVWIEAQLDRYDEWSSAVMTLVDRGVLAWSSGSASLYAKVTHEGEIKAWPVVEFSSTVAPAEPRQTGNVRLKHYVNAQDAPTEAQADQAARGKNPDIQTTENETEVCAMTLTLNEPTARAMVRAYGEAEWETIKTAVCDDTGAIKQAGMLEEALQPLAAELAAITGVEEAEALAFLIGFVAEKAVGTPDDDVAANEDLEEVMSEQPALSADMEKVVESVVAKAIQAQLPVAPQGQSRTQVDTDAIKSINLMMRSRADIEEIKSLSDLIYATTNRRHDLLRPYGRKAWMSHKALGINPDTAGGYLVQVEQSNQVIELLRDTAKVLPLCRQIPMNSDTMTVSKQTGGATAIWVGENSEITESQQTFGNITLVAKKLAAFVPVSNELIMDSDPSVDAIIREDISTVLALAIDKAILEGSGIGNEPLGLLNLGVTTTALNEVPTYNDLVNVVSRVEVENVAEAPSWSWVFNPREKQNFRKIQDARGTGVGVGAYIFTEGGSNNAMAGGIPRELLNYLYATTTQITPDTDDNNETEIYFGQWNDVIVGMRKTIEIRASDEAGAAFQNDQTFIRAIMRLDVNIRHAESIEILTDVRAS